MATSITTIQSTDLITNSRADINNNFDSLLVNKIETDVITTDSTFAAASDSKLPSQLAVKQYVDAGGNPDIAAAQAGGGDFGTPSATNKFVTEEKLEVSITQSTVYEYAASPVTWTKPTGAKLVRVQIWGGGGSGRNNGGASTACGGGGGSYLEGCFEASKLGATETITIGAGGAARASVNDGAAGGTTTFGSHLSAEGGNGGSSALGGKGGGVPNERDSFDFGGDGGDSTGGTQHGKAGVLFGGGGGGGANSGTGNGGAATFGGGGGGGASTNGGSGVGSGGVSALGGNGGAGSLSGTAVSGSVPGGGGGGTHTGTSGAGGNGRAIVTVYF